MTPEMELAVHTWILPITAGILLASATGLRAFLPLALVSWAAHFGVVPLSPSFHWMGSVPAVLAFTAAVVFEVLGDKVPAVDHFLDALNTFVKPVTGAIVVAAGFTELDPLYAVILGVLGGASIAEGVHILKAKGRVLGNLLTFGFAAPILSVAEDVVVILLVIAALAAPLVALALLLLFLYWLVRRRRQALSS